MSLSPSALDFRCYDWQQWSHDLLYAAMRLRSEVFVVEQNCVFLDMDGLDAHCRHLCGLDAQGRLLAYARLVPPGHKYPEPSIGRVVTAAAARGGGHGHALMRAAVAHMRQLYPGADLMLGAQSHLQGYYGAHGFVPTATHYLEDGIPHVDMRRAYHHDAAERSATSPASAGPAAA